METVEKLSADEAKDLEEEVSVPYRVEDVTVLSPGEWNGLQWTASELRQAVDRTDFSQEQERGDERPPNASVFYDHEDRSADQFVGEVDNVRVTEKGDVMADLVVSDKQAAMNLEFGAPFGVSPKADGMVDERGKMQDFTFENFSFVVNPAVKTTWLNEDITSVLQDMEVHNVKFNGTTEGEWNSPNLEDFTDESYSDLSKSEKEAIGMHFLISKSGFPAENYTDLTLPVVEPSGDLSLNALQNAKARVGQVSGIDEDEIRRVTRMINNLANGNFDVDFEEVDMAKNGMNPSDDEMSENKSDGSEEKTSTMVEYEYGDGDKVKWDNGSAMGVIRGRTKDSCYNSEIKGSNEICGEEDAPAYLIEIYDDEEEETTGTMVAHKQETLNKASFELNDIMVEKPMAEQEKQEPEAEEASTQEEESAETSENYVTAEELESFKSEVIETVQEELGDDEEEEEAEEVEDGDVDEAEASDTELSDFEEFRQENPELSLSDAAEEFEEQNRDVEDKIEEMQEQFQEQISDLESKLEEKEEEVEELSDKVSNPQRATQVSGDDGDEEDVHEKVSELSDEELHAAVFKNNLQSQKGVSATKEMIHND